MQWVHFELGWLNLWILAVVVFATPVLLNLVRSGKGSRGLKRATTLLVAGLAVFSVGQALRLKSIWDYATAASDQLITHGVYRISRNPGYFGATLVYLGMGLAGQ